MSVKRRANGKWQARWREASGRQRAKDFDRKVDAENHERKMRGGVTDGTYVAPEGGKLTVRQWSEQWLAGARNLGAGGRDTYQRDLERYILPALGDIPLRRLIDGTHIEEFLTAELERLAPSTVHRHYRTLRRMLQVAVDRKRLPTNPCGPIIPPRIPAAEMRFLTVAEVDALAAAISPRYRTWVHVAAYCGLRWSEGVGLRRARVGDGRITVAEQLVRRADGEWHRDPPKSRAGARSIAMPAFLDDEMQAHLDTWAQPGDDGLVFPNQEGSPLTGSSFTGNVFRPACVRAGLATKTDDGRILGAPRVHDLRHTAVALAIAAGAHPKAIQARLGHASISVTLDRYGHLFPEMDEQVAVALDGIRTEGLTGTGGVVDRI